MGGARRAGLRWKLGVLKGGRLVVRRTRDSFAKAKVCKRAGCIGAARGRIAHDGILVCRAFFSELRQVFDCGGRDSHCIVGRSTSVCQCRSSLRQQAASTEGRVRRSVFRERRGLRQVGLENVQRCLRKTHGREIGKLARRSHGRRRSDLGQGGWLGGRSLCKARINGKGRV
jgi:hypothetical protein